MPNDHAIEIVTDGPFLATSGLRGRGRTEIAVLKGMKASAASDLLRYVVSQVRRGHPVPAGKELAYGYWVIRFVERSGRLEIEEWAPDGSRFVPGVELTLTYWLDQHLTCENAGADFVPPSPEQMVAVSKGVFVGGDVEGVRYPAPGHMSGWYMTTEDYDGDVHSLSVDHLLHVTAARPDLARFLALPPGYRFGAGGILRDEGIRLPP